MRLFSELFILLTTKHQKSRLQKPNSVEDRQQQDTHTQILISDWFWTFYSPLNRTWSALSVLRAAEELRTWTRGK